MKSGGGESMFQTCGSCNAPIVVPSEIYYSSKTQTLASEEFASLTKDKPVNIEQVSKELAPDDSFAELEELASAGGKIESFENYQENLGIDAIEEKKAVEKIVAPSAADEKNSSFDDAPREIHPAIEYIQKELSAGRKVNVIKEIKEKVTNSLQEAKIIVEKIERGELVDISVFKRKQ